MATITATIITKNEEENIRGCIDSLLWVDEIVVLDCGSSDRTQEFCRQYAPKVKLQVTDWPGFGKQKNRALHLATSTWVLSIDADERVTRELQQEITHILQSNLPYIAYQIPRYHYFLGQPLRYGYGNKTDKPIRLAQKEHSKFSEDPVHERLIVTGPVGRLKQPLFHFSYAKMAQLLPKIDNYSTLGALKLASQHKTTSFIPALLHAIWNFSKPYFFQGGFLNGWRGFVLAFSKFEGTLYRYLKLWEKNKFQ